MTIIMMSMSLYSQDTNSDSIYKKEIQSFDNLLDGLNKDIKKEEKQINFLKNSLINNEVSSSKLLIELFNNDDNFFKIKKATITMNGKEIYQKSNISKKNLTIFNASSDPGNYTFNFQLEVEGAGYGIFTYMKAYKFKVNRTIKVEVPDIGKSKLKFIIYKNEKANKEKDPASMLKIKVQIL